MPFFQNAQNFHINNGQFNANPIFNNVTNVNADYVATILWPHVAHGAIFDSAERHAAGKCHPGTRKRIIKRIIAWATATDNDPKTPKHPLLWLHGSPGAGKSAIAHTICEMLKQKHPEISVASFFFFSGHPDRGNALKLFTTLSHQLAIQFPPFRSQINDALFHDQSLPTKSLESQFLSLIIQPLLQCQDLISHSIILVIDGLDECADDDAQREIIELIARSIIQHNLSVRVLVASRPEYWIRDAFNTEPLPNITQPLSLRDDLEADKDIEAYLIDGFEKIRRENKRVMGSVVAPWPLNEIIKHFVDEAAGQYVYASTILKFVGKSSRFCIPQKQLEILLTPGPHRALAFSVLDRLYATILAAYPQWETMKRVLGGLLVSANTTMIKAIFGVGSDELVVVLDALSSLIEMEIPDQPPDDFLLLESVFGSLLAGQEKISFYHRSFGEFLEDKSRSGAFHINVDAARTEIVKAFSDMIHHNLDQKYKVEPHLLANIDHFTYHGVLPNITSRCLLKCPIGNVLPHISRISQSLASFDLSCLSSDAILCFNRDTERVQAALFDFQLDRMYNEHIEFAAACDELYNTTDLAQVRAMDALYLCTIFKVTPTIVYLARAGDSWKFTIHDLCTTARTSDFLSTITGHRHFMRMANFRESKAWYLEPMNVNSFCNNDIVKPSRIHREWREAEIFIAFHILKDTLTRLRDYRDSKAESYLHDSISDIDDKDYFQNKDNISILALMTDQAAWSCFLRATDRPSMAYLIVAVLCWFNRQLMNPQSLKILQDYDESLQERLITTMKLVFEQCFLPIFMRFYFKELCAFILHSYSLAARDDEAPESIRLRALPLPQGLRTKQVATSADWYWPDTNWHIFHNEAFGKPPDARIEASVIDPLSWHPLLAARLLNALVASLYGQVHSGFSTRPDTRFQESFPYLAQCLPYAEPSLQNLDALRAIVYLYPRSGSTPMWDPPEGFWNLIMEFLQKYDRSLLSLEELDLFRTWLQSTDHADITTYVLH